MKKNELYSAIGFGTGIASLAVIIIPVLSLVLAIIAIVTSLLGKRSVHKGFFYAGLGLGCLGLILALIYLAVVLAGRA